MRVLTRILIYYVLISLVIFSAGGYAFYTAFRKEIHEELDEQMRDEKKNIERQLAVSDSMPLFTTGINFRISMHPVSLTNNTKQIQKKDTIIQDPFEGKIPFRQWRFYANATDQQYEVTIRKSLIDIEDLSDEIAEYLVYGFIAFLIGSIAINYLVLKRLFRPFNEALNRMRKYGVSGSGLMHFNHTSITEFRELNDVLENMTKRIHDDFLNIKEYTENASHEIQTPLAIISSKLELMMQNEKLDEEQVALLSSAFEATNRLYRLNQSLIMMSRIENREFKESSDVDLTLILKQLIERNKEQFDLKKINLSVDLSKPFIIPINPQLAEILFQNLLSNALRYTRESGSVMVSSAEKIIQIKNSGSPLPFPPDKIFVRFVSSGSNRNSLGIGLSLVKKIADIFSLQISYDYSKENSMHIMTIKRV